LRPRRKRPLQQRAEVGDRRIERHPLEGAERGAAPLGGPEHHGKLAFRSPVSRSAWNVLVEAPVPPASERLPVAEVPPEPSALETTAAETAAAAAPAAAATHVDLADRHERTTGQ